MRGFGYEVDAGRESCSSVAMSVATAGKVPASTLVLPTIDSTTNVNDEEADDHGAVVVLVDRVIQRRDANENLFFNPIIDNCEVNNVEVSLLRSCVGAGGSAGGVVDDNTSDFNNGQCGISEVAGVDAPAVNQGLVQCLFFFFFFNRVTFDASYQSLTVSTSLVIIIINRVNSSSKARIFFFFIYIVL